MNFFELTAYAAPQAAQPQTAGSMISMFLPFIIIIGVMYFLMIRPQKKKEKLKQEMLSQLIVGDKILTIGGIHGKIVSIKGDNLIIETGKPSEPSTLKIARWAISEVTKPGDENSAPAAATEADADDEE
ncbi:MAG: preprotein translocase subunit YajC [Clostridia bacterium]|nr:preprotein translocase subunit YajC [Clostridia bacterium]